MKKKKNKKFKISFLDLFKSIRKPVCKPDRVHEDLTKKDKILEIRRKELLDE
jgi:hypothetical protein